MACGCTAPAEIAAQTYVVQPDDTLYSIAWRHDIDFKDLAAWNNLGPTLRIEPGQILTLSPVHGGSSVRAGGPGTGQAAGRPAAGPAREVARVGKPRPLPEPRRDSPTAAATPVVPAMPVAPVGTWIWPTRARGAPTPVTGGGILILGVVGQDVMAAAAGKVVYVGSGLRGYGNLVIIKHSDALLSAYAHNQQLEVREGQWVAAGARIGTMGLGPRQIPALYFEIRLNGKPVSVAPYFVKK